ncbi:MAG: hypothetical protein AB7P99_04785 [Vicinamibacterales bacterium]
MIRPLPQIIGQARTLLFTLEQVLAAPTVQILREVVDAAAELRRSNVRLARRAQLAEGVARTTVDDCRRQGVSFGRSMATFAAQDAQRRAEAALEAAARAERRAANWKDIALFLAKHVPSVHRKGQRVGWTPEWTPGLLIGRHDGHDCRPGPSGCRCGCRVQVGCRYDSALCVQCAIAEMHDSPDHGLASGTRSTCNAEGCPE